MTVHESDGIAEALEDLLRIGVLLGTRLAERRIREREAQLREAAHHSLEEAQHERQRQLQQRSRALASIEGVYSAHWWDHASAQDIRQAWTAAREYQAEQPRAARAVWTIADELRDRYGLDVREIDPEALGMQPQLPAHATLSAQELREYDRRLRRDAAELQTERGTADPDRHVKLDQQLQEIGALRELIAHELADREQATKPEQDERRDARELQDALLIARRDGEPAVGSYDSAQRREQLAERLQALGATAGTVEAVVLADIGQAQPPDMATAQASTPQSKAATPRPRRTLQQQRRRNRG